MVQQGPEAGDFLIEEWFAAGSSPGKYGIGFQVFLNGAVNVNVQDQGGATDNSVIPVGAFQIVVGLLPSLFANQDIDIALPHGTGTVNGLSMRLDSASSNLVFTMSDVSSGNMLGEVYLDRGHAVATIDAVSSAVAQLNEPAIAPAGTFRI